MINFQLQRIFLLNIRDEKGWDLGGSGEDFGNCLDEIQKLRLLMKWLEGMRISTLDCCYTSKDGS